MYKVDKKFLPTNAGLIIYLVALIVILILPLLSRIIFILSSIETGIFYDEHTISLLIVVSIFATYGLVDDIIDVGRILKVLFPIVFCLPLSYVISPESVEIPFLGTYNNLNSNAFFSITYNDIIRYIFIPIYVMVVSNLVNMHSGYNGLQTGLSIILLITLLIKSIHEDKFETISISMAFLGAMVGFLLYNFYPSKVFEGNIGSLLFGSLLGSLIVLHEFWFFWFFILIPHTCNFLLWLYWLIMMRVDKEHYLLEDGNHIKFGSISHDGNIDVPFPLTLKWIPNYYFRLNEIQSVLIMYIITTFFCVLGLIIFK